MDSLYSKKASVQRRFGLYQHPHVAREKSTSFRLPQNVTWLYIFDWSLIGETHAPYVEDLQLFLPKKEYKTATEKVKTSTRIVVTADREAGSYVSANQRSSVLYKLPEMQTYVRYSLLKGLPSFIMRQGNYKPIQSLQQSS